MKCSPYCRGGHRWLTATVLDTINCGAHRDYSPEEIVEWNERAIRVFLHAKWEMPC